MNDNYFYDYVDILERVLSYAYNRKYATPFVERGISYSSFFQKIEKDSYGFPPIATDKAIIKEIFSKEEDNLEDLPTYNQCLWASESYMHIQLKTHLTFEAIFLFIPINKMYEYFPLYHEMDFSHIVKEFKRLFEQESVFSKLLKKYKYSLNKISENTGISYETLYSIKQRRREAEKASFATIVKISNIFNVRPETIAELEIL